jgi:hypothetical protein
MDDSKQPATIEYSCGHVEPKAPMLGESCYIDLKCAKCHVEDWSTPSGRPIAC